jgi:hypothetical protein
MAKEQRVDVTGCGYGREKLIETSRVSVEEAITAYSEDELEIRYYIEIDSNGCDYLCKLNVDVDYNEAGEDEFLFW